jgi:hypothetical protein
VPTGLNVSIPDLQALPRVAAAAYERGYALAFADTFRVLIPFIVIPLLAVLAMRDVRLANSVRTVRPGAPAREPSS